MNRDFTAPPRVVRKAKLDNLALVPDSLLPFEKERQELANQLPAGSTLIILPSSDSSARRTLEKVSSMLKAKGHRVRTLPAELVSL